MSNLKELLERIANQFRSMEIPQPIVHWGHPLMMAIVDHRTLAPWMFLFMAAGYTGGVLSLVMQRQPILESPHFWTGSIVLLLLLINGTVALTGFGGNKAALRTVHAYLGSTALCILFLHAMLGLKLGFSI